MTTPRKPFLGPIKGSFPAICAECGADTRVAGSCNHVKPGAKIILFPGVLDLPARVANMNVMFELGPLTPKPFPRPKTTILERLYAPSPDPADPTDPADSGED